MPIVFDPKQQSWEVSDLSEEEKDSLVEIARQMILSTLGEELADRIVEVAFNKGVKAEPTLDDIDIEDLGPPN